MPNLVEFIAPAASQKQRLLFEASLHFALNANDRLPDFCDSKNVGLTVNIETTAVYPEFHRRI
jgi:hypothetical protein